MASQDYADTPRRSGRARKAPASYTPEPITPVKNNKRKADDASSASSPSKKSKQSTPSPTTSSITSQDNGINDDAVNAASAPSRSPTNSSAAGSLPSTPPNRPGTNGEDPASENPDELPVESPGSRSRNKAKTAEEQLAEAEDAVRDPFTGEACPIAVANYTIDRLNRDAQEWPLLEKLEKDVANLLKSGTKASRTNAWLKRSFEAEMDERIAEATRMFNKARYAPRKHYDQKAVDMARREIELATEAKSLGWEWMEPDLFEVEAGRRPLHERRGWEAREEEEAEEDEASDETASAVAKENGSELVTLAAERV